MDEKNKILIVDDDFQLRKTLSDILTAKGYDTVAVAKGQTALNKVEKEKPAVALIDLKIEDISGLEVMKGIKKSSPETECIIMTGYGTEKAAIEAVNLGAFYYLQKPYDMDQLLVIIQRAVEKRESEKEIQESEEKWRNLFENSIEAVFTVDIRGNFTSINSALTSIMGYEKEEIIGCNFAKYATPEVAEDVFKAYNHLYRTGEPIRDFTYEVIRKDGEVRTVEGYVNVIREGNEVTGFQGTLRDITERIRAEESLKESEEKYRILVESANDGIAIIQDGLIEYVNQSIGEISGYSAEELIDTSFIDFIHTDEISRIAERHKRRMAGEEVISIYETALKHKDGHKVDVEFNASFFTYKEKPAVQVIIRDITERKLAEDRIRSQNEFLTTTIDSLIHPFYVINVDDYNVVLANSAANFGKLDGDSRCYSLVYGHDEPCHTDEQKCPMEIIKETKKAVSLEHIHYDEEGNKRIVEIHSSPLFNEKGELVQIIEYNIDITERKLEEEELIRQSTAVRISRDCIVISDIDGTIIDVNEATIKAFEADGKEDIIGKSSLNILAHEYREKAILDMEEVLEREYVNNREYNIITKKGNKVPIEMSVALMNDTDGEPVGFVGICRDITERKRTEERIAHLNRVLKSIRNINQLIVIEKDKKTLLGQACEILVEVSGYLFVWIGMIEEGHKKVIPVAQWGFEDGYLEKTTITWDDEKTGRGPTGTAIKTKKTCVLRDVLNSSKYASWKKEAEKRGYKSSIAVPLVHKETVYGALNVYSYNIDYFDKEEVMLLEEVAQDIAFALSAIETEEERKQAEESISEINKLLFERTVELKKSEEKWRALFETSKDVVYISTVDGRFLDINPAGEELFGYARDELLELDILDIYMNKGDRKKFLSAIEERGFVKDHEITFKKKDGTTIDSLSTATVRRDSKGNIIGYHGIIRDITERKKFAAQLIQTEKLSSLGGILSGVAHELNNPLTAIIGNAQLLARREISGEIKDKLEVIQKESMRCTKIVGGLLAFAREHKPERKIISVNDVIMESYKLREYELRVDDVDIELDLQKHIPRTSADPYQLQQVFINLINNAHDALKEKSGGVLNIKSYWRDETILIEFEDNGPGIPKENINKIFDPFFTTKEVGEGTGLGLGIVFGIINEHGGKIYIESEIDKGTKFTIELPIVKDIAEEEEIKIERSKKPEGAISVLVVEDEESMRDLISEVLSSEGYVVEAAGSGEKAVDLLKKGGYDVIISDMKMPGMSGHNLYTFVQKEYPELIDKMLFVTGDVLGKETQHFFKITGVKYIEKPFVIDKLLHELNDLLSN